MLAILARLAFITTLFSASAQAETVLITGSNRGIGLEFAKQYAAKGWTVIATARTPAQADDLKALAAAHKNVTVEKLDLLDQASIDALAVKYKGKPIDILLNNAGVLGDAPGQTFGTLSRDTFTEVMAVNVFGPLAVSQAFRDNVAISGQKKIVAVTSGSGIISGGRRRGGATAFYNISKVALNMAMKGLGGDLAGNGVIVGLIAPGTVETDMRRAAVGPERAAQDPKPEPVIASMIKVIDAMTQENTAQPVNFDGRPMPW